MADKNNAANTQTQTNENFKLFINAIEKALADTAIPLVEVPYGPKNYAEIFRHGFIESPIESIKMGGNQFIKFATVDRDFTMGATYETLTNPSLICEIITDDKKTSTKKPIHIYAKSFVIQDTNNKKVIQSLVVMKTEGKFVSGAFPNDISEMLTKIKKTDEIIYANENIRRVATSLLRVTGSHEWEVKTSPTNPLYDTSKILSIKQLEKDGKITTGKLEITKDTFNEYYTYFIANTKYKNNSEKVVNDIIKYHVRPQNIDEIISLAKEYNYVGDNYKWNIHTKMKLQDINITEKPMLSNNISHDKQIKVQQFDTDKNTVNTLVDLVQKSGIPCHADRDEFFRVKKLIEESKGDADCMTLRQAVAGFALGVSLMAMPAQLHANSKDKKIITPSEISQAQSMAKMGREYMYEMGMNIVDENNIERYLGIETRVQGLMAQFPEKSYEEVRSAVANNIFGQFDSEAKKDASHAIRKIKSGGETYYVFFEDESRTTFITEGAMSRLQEIADGYTQSLSESPQFQINEGVTFGYVYKGEMYLNPDLINTNTICHEYTHLWDEHVRITNPELCKKGIELYKNTTLWKDSEKTIWEQVESDEFYKEKWETKSREPDANGISNYDQAIFSECHARAVGKFGAEVLRRIREEDGIDIADAVIDWNKEASDYLSKEFGVEFADDDIARDFFAKPMQDLFSRKKILWELDAENLSAQFQTEKENISQKERTVMENNFDYMPDSEYFANWENMTEEEKQESSKTRKVQFDIFVKDMNEQGISSQQELDDYIQNHINNDVGDADPYMEPYGENNLKNLVRARQAFMKEHPKVFMEEKQAEISETEKDEQQDMEVKESDTKVETEEKSGEVSSPSFGSETDALFAELKKTDELLESEQKALKNASYPKNKAAENWNIFRNTVSGKNDTIKTLMDIPESKLGETLPLIKAEINGEDRLLLQFSQNYDIESGKWYGANMAETEPTKQSQKELKEFQKSNKSGEITRALNEQIVNELGDKYDKDTDILQKKLGITHDEPEIQETEIDWPKASDIKIPERNTLMNFISGAKTCRTVEDYERLYDAYKEKFTVVENRGDAIVLPGEPCPESFCTPVHPGPATRTDENGNSVVGPDGKIPYKYMTFSEKMAYDREQIWKKYHQDKVLFRSADPNELQAYKMLNNLVEADEIPTPEHFKELIKDNMTKGEGFDVGKAIEEEYTEIEDGYKTSFENVKNNPNPALFAPLHLAQLDNFLEAPYKLGTTVPVFSKTDSDGVLNEYRDMSVIGFEGEDLDTEGNPIRDEKGRFTTAKQIVLGKTLPDGQEITVKMSVDEYASMRIENEKLRENIKDTTLSEETMEKIKNEYQDKMGLSKDKIRTNTMENYLHNYEAICRTKAENLSEAMTEAKKLFDSMPEEERNKLLAVTSRFADESGEQTGLSNFEQKLVDIYNTSRKESPMTDVEMPNEDVFSKMKEAGLSDELVEEMKSKTVAENGKPLSENADIKVGDTISWKTEVTMPFTDAKISETGEYSIVSGNSTTNTVVLMSADKTSRLEVSYDDVVKTAKIIEPKETELQNAEVENPEEDVNFSFAEDKEKEAEQTVTENTEKEKDEPDGPEKNEAKSEELSAKDNSVSEQNITESETPHEEKTDENEKTQPNIPTIMDSVGSNTAADFVRNFEAVCRAASTWQQAKEIKAELYRRLPPEQQEAYKQMAENYEAENKGRKFDNCLRSIWESSVSMAKRKEANSFATDFDAASAIDEYKMPDVVKESNASIMPGETNLKVGDSINYGIRTKSYDESGEKWQEYLPPNKITGFSAENNTVQIKNEKTGTVFEQKLDIFVETYKAKEKERAKKLEAEKQRSDDDSRSL